MRDANNIETKNESLMFISEPAQQLQKSYAKILSKGFLYLNINQIIYIKFLRCGCEMSDLYSAKAKKGALSLQKWVQLREGSLSYS